jgi:hypothetical protein
MRKIATMLRHAAVYIDALSIEETPISTREAPVCGMGDGYNV